MILLTYISHFLPCRLSYFSQYISHSNLLFKKQSTVFYRPNYYVLCTEYLLTILLIG